MPRLDSLSSVAAEISSLQQKLDAIRDEKLKQRHFDALPAKKQEMPDALWGQLYSDSGRKNIPVSDGRWTGEAGDSIWIPDDSMVPLDKGYNNMYYKSWRQIKVENGINGIRFFDGRAGFRPVSPYSLKFDWEHVLGRVGVFYLLKTGDRQFLHEAAFSQLAVRLSTSVTEVKRIKESRNLVWHEEPDCTTLRLVVREVHDNIKHFGGIEMLSIVFADSYMNCNDDVMSQQVFVDADAFSIG